MIGLKQECTVYFALPQHPRLLIQQSLYFDPTIPPQLSLLSSVGCSERTSYMYIIEKYSFSINGGWPNLR